MSRTWSQETKSRLSKLVNKVLREGPQIITCHGDRVAVVISYAEYVRMQKPQVSLVEFFRERPWLGSTYI
jgi:antitoxin Phd